MSERNAALPDVAPATPTLAAASWYWLRLGCVSFGGPAGQIALMHEELVVRRRWISESRFLHALDYCMALPGPEAQQLATYVGWRMHRTAGGLVAGGLFVLPSLAILIALSWLYVTYGTVPAVAGAFDGVKPAVIAIVAVAAWRIGRRVLTAPWLWAVAAAAFVALWLFAVPFPLVLLAAAATGAIGFRFAPRRFPVRRAHVPGSVPGTRAVIDDDTPTPAHARFDRARFVRSLLVFAAIWVAAMAGLAAFLGPDATPTRFGWFFTKAALLTFGGAYAVLPYVVQGAVVQYGWLTATQMIDGLALGETTPGPLIMVVAFVGYVGGSSQHVLGAHAPFLSGAFGASVATFFTFLPSFLFILVGGPVVESTHGSARLAAPLTAITAAVVGVIVDLALFFAGHVLWPQGLTGPFDLRAALLAIAAGVALFRFRVGVIPVVFAAGLVGLVLRLLA